MGPHVEWEELPDDVRQAVELRTGRVVAAEVVEEGLNCSTALVLDTERAGAVFLKGVLLTDSAGVGALTVEARVNTAVAGVGPRLLWAGIQAGGWYCLVFDYVDGCHADLSPGSPDLDSVALLLRRMQLLRAPALPFPQLAARFRAYLCPGEAGLLRGDHLLHTDANPHNILISDDGSASLVDWAMPALGPAWVDAAYTAVRLMESGIAPVRARAWLYGFESWKQADVKSVRTFIGVTCRHWDAVVGPDKARPSNQRFLQLIE
ncbi:phosphotransferase [Streptomyces spiramyceticus]|uniref:phosphotransferase n=1 Tax=Streptomyces spiramyceticus TaxID=299717 RepID=UPI00237C4A77|nr:phosphotransferase [Streptomyces spiramyceticus]